MTRDDRSDLDKAHSSVHSKDMDTNTDEEEDIKRFGQELVEMHSRRLSLRRSPQREDGFRSLFNIEVKTPDEQNRTGQKRVRSPEEKKMIEYEIIMKQMEEMNKMVKNIYDLAIGNNNTKVEIKNGAKDLKRKMERIQTRMISFEKQIANGHQTKARRRDNVSPPKKETKTCGTQVDPKMMEEERKETKKEEEMCLEQLNKREGWEGMKKILDLTWPEAAYTNTKHGKDKKLNEPGDMAILVDPKQEVEVNLVREVSDRFSDILPLIKNGLKQTEQLKRVTDMIGENGKREEITNFLWVIPLNENHGVEDTYKKIDEIKRMINKEDERKINLVVSENVGDRYIRKYTEEIFHDTKCMITIWSKNPPQKGIPDQITGKIIMRTEGKDYANALRKIRETVNLDQMGIKVKNIRKTAQGDVFLEVSGGKEKANALKGSIERECGAKVEIKKDTSIFYISDIEAGIS